MKTLGMALLILGVMWGATLSTLSTPRDQSNEPRPLIHITVNPRAGALESKSDRYVFTSSEPGREWALYADLAQTEAITTVPSGTRLELLDVKRVSLDEPGLYILKVKFRGDVAWIHPNNTTGRIHVADMHSGHPVFDMPIFIRMPA